MTATTTWLTLLRLLFYLFESFPSIKFHQACQAKFYYHHCPSTSSLSLFNFKVNNDFFFSSAQGFLQSFQFGKPKTWITKFAVKLIKVDIILTLTQIIVSLCGGWWWHMWKTAETGFYNFSHIFLSFYFQLFSYHTKHNHKHHHSDLIVLHWLPSSAMIETQPSICVGKGFVTYFQN